MVADTCLPEHVLDPATAFCVLPAMAVAVVAWAADAAGVLCDAAVADAVLLLLLPHPVTSSKNPATRATLRLGVLRYTVISFGAVAGRALADQWAHCCVG